VLGDNKRRAFHLLVLAILTVSTLVIGPFLASSLTGQQSWWSRGAWIVVGIIVYFLYLWWQARSPAGSRDTIKTTPPEVIATDPKDLAVDVPPDIHPTVNFSKAMDSVSINADTFKLLRQDALQVPARFPDGVVYDEATRKATFTPAQPLEKSRTYTATITARVKDQAGNRLEDSHIWHFTIVP
jgi:Ca2+/Na+ antiporter